MSRLATLAGALLVALASNASAQELLIRNATVHTATSRGTLQGADVLVRGGRIAAMGPHLSAAANVPRCTDRPSWSSVRAYRRSQRSSH